MAITSFPINTTGINLTPQQFADVINNANTFQTSSNYFTQNFTTDGTFTGVFNSIELRVSETCSIVSFWGSFNQQSAGTPGASNVCVSPTQFPLLSRFIGQVDQFAVGYNAATNDFKYVPMRITANAGIELVTAPNITVGTVFSYQFVLILTNDVTP